MARIDRVTRSWIRNRGDELAVEHGCYFDQAAADHVVSFLETECHLSEGRWAGQPMRLLAWQREAVPRIYGWKRPDGRRRFRWVYVEIGKKNGKSPLGSGLAMYHLVADGEGGPSIFINGCDRSQTRIVFAHAANMARQSPSLAGLLEVIDSDDRIVCEANYGRIQAGSATVEAKDGLNASLVLNDEIHRWRDRKLWNVFRHAGASREQPLSISFTTAGDTTQALWHEQREYAEAVNDGRIPDTEYLGIVYRADPKDDIDDPRVWRKANPALGETLDPDQFGAELARAKRSPDEFNEFLRLRLNIVAGSSDKYLPPDVWARGNTPPRPLSRRPTWIGIDLSAVNDLTAVVAIQGSEAEGFDLHPWFFLPEGGIERLEHAHGRPYRAWAEAGFLTLTPSMTVDYAWIIDRVVAIASSTDTRGIYLDPWNGVATYTALQDRHGLPVEMVRQGPISLNDATKQLQRHAIEGRIRHGGHPVLAWHASNAVARTDHNGNVALSKERSSGKIDGLSAAVNAFVGIGTHDDTQDGPSIYETRGVHWI